MNKNLIMTALLVAVVCQPVSAVSPAPVSMMSKAFTNVTSFVKNNTVACAVGVVSTGLLVAGYKWATKEKVWVEGNCLKFRKRTPFRIEEGSMGFKSSEEAVAAYKVFKDGNVFGGFSRIQEVAKAQKTNPSLVWNPRPMTEADAEKFSRDMEATFKEHDRIMKQAFGEFGYQV